MCRYLHSVGIVHRDLKPENLLYSTNDPASPKYDVIKVADFGLAKIIAGAADHSMSTTCGTPGYVAPEILEQKGYGKEVDLWSIGVILYILLCGFPPFYDDNNSLLFMAIKKGDYSFPSPYWDKVSKPAIDLIQNLLQVDPAKRLTIEEAMLHPWISGKDSQSSENLVSAQEQLKKFNAKKKLKNAINSVLAVRDGMERGAARVLYLISRAWCAHSRPPSPFTSCAPQLRWFVVTGIGVTASV
jgi:calcium/calmodulin-dependent protein kinase I